MATNSHLICLICNAMFNEPIFLPCHCTVCRVHIKDMFTDGEQKRIKCSICETVSNTPEQGFQSNKLVESLLKSAANLKIGLSKEKTFLLSLTSAQRDLALLSNQHQAKYAENEAFQFDHFAGIKRKIDLRRETLQLKIDEIAAQMIENTKKSEEEFSLKLVQNKMAGLSLQNESASHDPFRNAKFVCQTVEEITREKKQQIDDLNSCLTSMQSSRNELKDYTFENRSEFAERNFGQLNLKKIPHQASRSAFFEYDYDDDDDDIGYNKYFTSYKPYDTSSMEDYTACDKECGYCGHCPY